VHSFYFSEPDARPEGGHAHEDKSAIVWQGVSSPPNATQMRLQGRWLVLARGLWITLVILTLAIFFASLPVFLALLQTPCTGTACSVSSS